MTTAEVVLWGKRIAAVSWNSEAGVANFEYDGDFARSSIEVAPLIMPLSNEIYSFPALSRDSFRGLPGLLADSLPDDFGNAVIDAWLTKQGRAVGSFNPVERLCYTGTRGMGALEYAPSTGPDTTHSERVDIQSLVALATRVLTTRDGVRGSFSAANSEHSLQEILRVGTSAGGARAKAVVAWNSSTNEVRSGHVQAGSGFSYWLLKFDGVSGNRDKELDDPAGYGLIEYAYSKMALAAGIDMCECRVLEENGRSHFMTRRFDRTDAGRKIHMQSLGAMMHADYRQAGAHSYEQAIAAMRKLNMPMASIEQQFRRMAFNVIGRNQDDHVKNIAYLMDRSGSWSLSPAFDVTYSYNPEGLWTGSHQMSLNGKRDDFEIDDFIAVAKNASMQRGRAKEIVRAVERAVRDWRRFAEEAGVADNVAAAIATTHRLDMVS